MSDSHDYTQFSSEELEIEILKYLPSMTLPDPVKRNEAEINIEQMSKNVNFFFVLSSLYSRDPRNVIVGILLRNSLMASDPTLRKRIQERFFISTHIEEMKKNLLRLNDEISHDCVARIGTLELIRSKWPNFFIETHTRSLVLAIYYLQTYSFNFKPFLETIFRRLADDSSTLISIIEIFENNLPQDRLDFLLKSCFSNFNFHDLTKLFDVFFNQIDQKQLYVNFVSSNAEKDPENVIKFFRVLEKNNFPYDPKCMYNFLNSDDNRIISATERLLCDTMDKIFKQNEKNEFLQLKELCKQSVNEFLQQHINTNSFIRMIGCCPYCNKPEYYDFLIKQNSFWTISRLAQNDFEESTLYLPEIIKQILIAIESTSDEEACLLLQNLASQVDGDQYENELSFCFVEILNTLVLSSERIKYTEYEKRSALFSALIELIKSCSQFLRPGLEKLLFYLINKVKEGLKIVDSLNMNEFLILEDILTWYISLIEEILKKQKHSNNFEMVYDIYYDILNIKKVSSLVGDVYITLSCLITEHSFFLGKMDELVQFISRDIKYRPGQDIYTFRAAHLLIGDISHVLSKSILKYSFLAQMVIQNLGSDFIQRSIKPVLLSVLGDLIFAMGISFTYKDLTCRMLQEIIEIDRNIDILFVDELRRSAIILLDNLLITFESELDEKIVVNYLKTICLQDDRNHCISQLTDLAIDYVSVFGSNNQREVIIKIIENGKKINLSKTDQLSELL